MYFPDDILRERKKAYTLMDTDKILWVVTEIRIIVNSVHGWKRVDVD